MLETNVGLLGDRARQRVVAALDLAVGLAPRELYVELLRVGNAQRRSRRGLGDGGEQQLGGLRDARPAQPLRDRLVVARLRAPHSFAKLTRDLGRGFRAEPFAAEDELWHVGAEAE